MNVVFVAAYNQFYVTLSYVFSFVFSYHHFREYAQRRVRDGFKKAKTLATEADQERELELAKESLQVIKRQVSIFLLKFAGRLSEIILSCLLKIVLSM